LKKKVLLLHVCYSEVLCTAQVTQRRSRQGAINGGAAAGVQALRCQCCSDCSSYQGQLLMV
jgi:hypothetical protein